MAIRIENRYKGLRAPHKLKSAVSGCARECAEAQGKDFGIIATEKGYNLYLCGNGGMKPQHALLFATDLDEETLIRYIDRFLMFYVRTADRLQRTADLAQQPRGRHRLPASSVIIDDSLGICAELEAEMAHVVDTYQCEWKAALDDPEKLRQFRAFVNSDAPDPSIVRVPEREQHRPATWEEKARRVPALALVGSVDLSVGRRTHPMWPRRLDRRLRASTTSRPTPASPPWSAGCRSPSCASAKGTTQIFAVGNYDPFSHAFVIARGIVGDRGGVPKIASPIFKQSFDLRTGQCLDDRERTHPLVPDARPRRPRRRLHRDGLVALARTARLRRPEKNDGRAPRAPLRRGATDRNNGSRSC